MLARTRFALLALLLLPWWLSGCARLPQGALTPLQPGQLERRVALAAPGLDDDPLQTAEAIVEAEAALGQPDVAAWAAREHLERAQMAWSLATLEGDAAAIRRTRRQLHDAVRLARHWADEGRDAALAVQAIMAEPNPRRHRRALRQAVAQLYFAPSVDLSALLEALGDHEPSRDRVAYWRQHSVGELGLEPGVHPRNYQVLANAFQRAVSRRVPQAELKQAVEAVLAIDPHHVPAQLVQLGLREVEGGVLKGDALLWEDLVPSYYRFTPSVARLHLRGRAYAQSSSVRLGLAWLLLHNDRVGDAHAVLEAMTPPSDPAAAALHAQLVASVGLMRGEVAAFEHWRISNDVRSISIDDWLSEQELLVEGPLHDVAARARRRRVRSEAPAEMRSIMLTALDDRVPPRQRARMLDRLHYGRHELRNWIAVCREQQIEAGACFETWLYDRTLDAMAYVQGSERFQANFLSFHDELEYGALVTLEPMLRPYEGRLPDATSILQSARLRIDLVQGEHAEVRARLQSSGPLLEPALRTRAWLVLDDLESGRLELEQIDEHWVPEYDDAFASDPPTVAPPASRIERYSQGMMLARAGQHAQALELLLPVLDEVPDEVVADGLGQAALAAHLSGDAELRDVLRHRLRAAEPHGTVFARLQARLSMEAGDAALARRFVTHALRWHPTDEALLIALLQTFGDEPPASEAEVLAFVSRHATGMKLPALKRAIDDGQITSLATLVQAESAFGDGEAAWALMPQLGENPWLARRAIEHGVTQVQEAPDLQVAMRWASDTLDLIDQVGVEDHWRRNAYLWLSLLAGRAEAGLRMADLVDREHAVEPVIEGDSSRLLLRARAKGEVDDALAWDLWRWVYDSDAEASARIEAMLGRPPAGSVLELFACGELISREDYQPAYPVCQQAWASQPGVRLLNVNLLFLGINHSDPVEGAALVDQVLSSPFSPPAFVEQPDLAAQDNLVDAWHQNLAVWYGDRGEHERAAEAWWQAHAFGFSDADQTTHDFEQMPWRGRLVRAAAYYEAVDDRTDRIYRAFDSFNEPDPVAARGYAEAAAAWVVEEPGTLDYDRFMLPDRLRHLSRWAEADLAASRIDPRKVGEAIDLIFDDGDLPRAEALHGSHPDSSLTQLALLLGYRSIDERDRARPLAEALLKRHPDDPVALYYALPLRLAAGASEDELRAAYEQALALHPGDQVLRFIDLPESITGLRDGVPDWVRDPARYDARIAQVTAGEVMALVPQRHASDEKAAEVFAPRTWVAEDDLRYVDNHGSRMLVLTSPRASRCVGEDCARDLLKGLEGGGRTRQWTRQTKVAGVEATQALLTNADEVLVTWVVPSGGRVFTLVVAVPVERFDLLRPALVMFREGFRPLDGVLPPFAAESLRAGGPTLRDAWRLRARREQVAQAEVEGCPVSGTLSGVPLASQRAELLLDLWLATAQAPARRQLLRCAEAREATARRLALVALLDDDPRVHEFGLQAVRTHASQVAEDTRAILSSPLSPPVSSPEYLVREDLPSHGLVEVIGALPPEHAGTLVERLLASQDLRDRTLAWAGLRLRPALVTEAIVDAALADEARLQMQAIYLLSDRGRPEDVQRLRRHFDALVATGELDQVRVIDALALALALQLEAEDGARLKGADALVLDGEDAERAERWREHLRDAHEDHARGLALRADPSQAITAEDGRALRWLEQLRRRALPSRAESELRVRSLAQLLPGSDWTFARLAAPGLFSSTAADVVERLTTGDEAVDQRLSELTTRVLREGGFAALSASGGLDTSKPIECAQPFNENGWLCTARVVDREALLEVFGNRAWGDDAGISLPLSVATTAGIIPVVLSALPAMLHPLVYPEDDDDSGPATDVAAERARITIEEGGMTLERYSIIDIDTWRTSIDSERYLFLGDRLWVFSTDSSMERVMRQHEGPTLADDAEFQRLTKDWTDGSALQAVAVGHAWSLAEGGASMEVVLDEGGLHFRYAGAFESEDEIVDIGPALAQLPEGAVSIFAHGLGAAEDYGKDELKAKGPDELRVPPMPLLASAKGVAFGWYFQDGDHLWRRWLAVAPLDAALRKSLSKRKTPPGRGRSRRHGGLCYRERGGYLLVGDCALVDEAAAKPVPAAAAAGSLKVGHGTFDGAAAAERLPGLDGLTTEQKATVRAVAPLLAILEDLEVQADWRPAERVAVLEGRVGLRLRPPGDRSQVIDDWLAATEGRNAATLPRRLRKGEIEGPLRYEVEVPDAEDFVRHTLADSPRIEAEVVSPTIARFVVRPEPAKVVPVTLDEDERKRLTKQTSLLRPEDPRVIEVARSIAPEGTSPTQAADRIQQWVHEQIDYEITPRSLDGAEILTARRGDCSEYATLTVTLLRAVGVPAEIRDGMAASGDEMVAHAWVAYHDGTSWHEIDPTWGRTKVSAGHLEMSVLDALALISLGKLKVLSIEPL